uniref:Uncharacterized protein n=1 Tax=Sinocyclocheilus rhinocerous TaxID=307959 RepID=A0A673FX73_9TELE
MSNNRFCSPSFSAGLYINTEPATLSYSSTCFQTREKETERGIHSDKIWNSACWKCAKEEADTGQTQRSRPNVDLHWTFTIKKEKEKLPAHH